MNTKDPTTSTKVKRPLPGHGLHMDLRFIEDQNGKKKIHMDDW